MSSLVRYALIALGTILPITLNTGLNPRFIKYSISYLRVLVIATSVKSFTGVARIACVVQSYGMKIVVIPFNEQMGKVPVKSTYMVLSLWLIAAR